MDRHFHSPTASVRALHAIYTNFYTKRVVNALGSLAVEGANVANAWGWFDEVCKRE